jgi:putative ABC transport system permease protein
MIKDIISLAAQNIRHRKVRSWLTVIGVVIGTTAVFGLISLGLGMNRTVQTEFTAMFGTDTFLLVPEGVSLMGPGGQDGGELYALDLESLKSIEGVKTAASVRQQIGYVVGGTPQQDGLEPLQGFFPVVGMSSDLVTEFESFLGKMEIEPGGRFFDSSDADVAVLGSNIATRFGVDVGDTLLLTGDGSLELLVTVVGIMNPGRGASVTGDEETFAEEAGVQIDQDTIGVPYGVLDRLWQNNSDVLLTLVRTEPGVSVDHVATRVETVLNEQGAELDAFTPTDIANAIGQMTGMVGTFLAGIAGISLLVGAVGVMNTMYTAVMERTKEVGVFKAVGAKRRDILLLFLMESGLIGLIGGVVGVLLGLGLNVVGSSMIGAIAGIPAAVVVDPVTIAATLLGSFVLGGLAGLWPARRASKLQVVDALRYE